MKKLKLNVMERFQLINCLPQQGGYHLLNMANDIRDKVYFTEFECKKIGYQEHENNQVTWKDANAIAEQEIELTDAEFDLVKEALKERDQKATLIHNQRTLFKKIVIDCGGEDDTPDDQEQESAA